MAQSANDGLKITIRSSLGGKLSSQNTQYFQSDRKRMEDRTSSGSNYGPPLAFITRCDTGQMITLNLEDKQYVTHPLPKFPSEEERRAQAAKYSASAEQQKPTVLVEVTTVDTGERKRILDHEARHVITTQKETRLNDARDLIRESVTDGWYTDLPTSLSCEAKPRSGAIGFLTFATKGRPADVPTVKLVGKLVSGFPLYFKTTAHNVNVLPDGSKSESTSSFEQQVTDLYSGPLDSQLFEIPRGFNKVSEIRSNPSIPLSTRIQEYWNYLMLKVSRLFG